MNFNEISDSLSNLPESLTNSDTIKYLKKYKSGDKEAKNKIVIHNLRLIIFRIVKKFKKAPYDINELISVGVIGLIKAIERFDINKEVNFSTYATYYIDGEIYNFLRDEKNKICEYSFNQILKENSDGEEYFLDNILYDNKINIEKEYEQKEFNNILREYIEELSDREKEIIKLYYGFDNNKIHTQKEISEIFGFSQTNTSAIIKKALEKLKIKLENNDLKSIKSKVKKNI